MSFVADIDDALAELEHAFDRALETVLPNPAALTFTDLVLGFQGKRDLLFALDLLNEGENEAALIAGLARDALHRAPTFDVSHLAREAWYYLRTSIDPNWQFDDGEPSLPVALAYIAIVLRERVDGAAPDDRRSLLQDLRGKRDRAQLGANARESGRA